MAGHHRERLEAAIAWELSKILSQDSRDARLKFVTLTKVRLSGDLSLATCFYTVWGKADEVAKTKDLLAEATGFLRAQLAVKVKMRKVPDLRFKYDNSYEYGQRIEAILSEIADQEKTPEE